MRIRLKYTISIIILGVVIYWNWNQIPIQDNFVDVIKWVLGGITAGFGVKKVAEKFGKLK